MECDDALESDRGGWERDIRLSARLGTAGLASGLASSHFDGFGWWGFCLGGGKWDAGAARRWCSAGCDVRDGWWMKRGRNASAEGGRVQV
jgi:hypothetical protein